MDKKVFNSGEGNADKIGVALCSRSDAFWYNYETGDATTAIEILAAPTDTTKSHYITDIIISNESAMAIELRGTVSSGSPASTGVGLPKQYSAANSVHIYNMSQPYKIGESNGINLKTYSAGNVTIWIGGYTI